MQISKALAGELTELQQLVLALQRRPPAELRGPLVNRIAAHRLTQRKLRQAAGILLQRQTPCAALTAELIQEASGRLVERMMGGKLIYADHGLDQFGGWLYTVCRVACQDASRK